MITPEMMRDFIATFDQTDLIEHRIASRLREQLYGEMYRGERERYPEWVDHGGEA